MEWAEGRVYGESAVTQPKGQGPVLPILGGSLTYAHIVCLM